MLSYPTASKSAERNSKRQKKEDIPLTFMSVQYCNYQNTKDAVRNTYVVLYHSREGLRFEVSRCH
jgi:hypothetical protein